MTIQDSRREYEGEVINLFANMGRAPRSTISDADYENELSSAAIFYNALMQFRSRVLASKELTGMRKDALTELLDGLEDLTPNMTAWEEEISNAKRGYIGAGGIK